MLQDNSKTDSDENSKIVALNLQVENYNIKSENLEKLSQLAVEDSCHQTHPYSVIKLDFQNCFTGALIG